MNQDSNDYLSKACRVAKIHNIDISEYEKKEISTDEITIKLHKLINLDFVRIYLQLVNF